MKVLYISTVFPKNGTTSTIYTDLAEELVKNGHEVTVVAAEEKKKISKTVFNDERGCHVLRVKVGNMYDVGMIEKGISIVFLEKQLSRGIKRYLKDEEFDLILFEAPPITLSGVVKKAKRMYNAPAFLMMKDIFPQNAVDIGIMKKGSIIWRFFRKKEKKLYEIADNIGCMSQGNIDYLINNNDVSSEKLSIFENTKRIHDAPAKDLTIRDKYRVPSNKTVFVFGGNMGKPQGISFLMDCIEKCQNNKNAFFVLVGRGTEKQYILDRAKNMTNILVLDNLPREEYEKLINCCDVGIVSLDYRFTIPNYPSRILSYMEYAMPVLATTDNNTDYKKLIENAKCGYWCPSNSISKFCDIVNQMCDDQNLSLLGKNGRNYLEHNLDVKKSVTILENYVINNKR